MSLQIIKQPDFFFTGNPAAVVFKKKGILDTVGGYARLYLVLDDADPPVITDTLILKKNSASFLTFTFVDFPSELPGDVPYITGGGFDTFCIWLAKEFYKHPLIAKDYTVKFLSYDSGTGLAVICFTARNRGIDSSLDIDVASTMHYDASTSIIAGVDDVLLSDYKLSIAVEAIADVIYDAQVERIENIEVTGKPDLDKDEVILELHELPALSKSVMHQDMPDVFFLPSIYRGNFAPLFIEVTETIADAGKKSLVDQQQFSSALFMGLPLTHSNYDKNFFDWINLDTQNTTFLNFTVRDSRSKMIDFDSPEFLNFVYSALFQTFIQRFTVAYDDGSTDVFDKTISVPDCLYDYIIRIPSGWSQIPELALLQPAKTAIYYEVDLHAEDESLFSETFRYVIDSRSFKQKKYFVYKNSVGCLDTIRFVGVSDFSIKRAGERTTSVLQYDTNSNRGTIEMVYNEREEFFTLRTGWMMSKEEKDLLTDFLQSTYVAEIILPLLTPDSEPDEDGNQSYYIQPVRACDIIADSTEMFKDDDGTWSAEFKMRYAHIEQNYFNGPRLPKKWYDTIIEFTIEVTDVIPDTDQQIQISAIAGSSKLTINGGELPSGNQNIDVTAGIYHLKLQASECTDVLIFAVGLEAKITITKIETATITQFVIAYFDEVKDDYLKKRIETFWSLQQLAIYTNNDPGFSIDDMLAALITLFNNSSGIVTAVDFSYSTPTAIGYALSVQLTADGVSVYTL